MLWSVAVALSAACGGSQQPFGVVPTSGALDHLPNHKSFYYTGAGQLFKVPKGVTSIDVVARGGAGGGLTYYRSLSGRGGRVHALIPVNPGEKLYVFVGGVAVEKSGRFTGGFNGGGNPGGGDFAFGGGGASDIRLRGQTLSDRILVVGGGGGEGGFTCCGGEGGRGGGLLGGAGASGRYDPGTGGGGGGGTQNDGGTGGKIAKYGPRYARGQPGGSGTRGIGGAGGNGGGGDSESAGGGGGGGGGGGYFGGGGGGGGTGGYHGGSGTGGGGGGGGSSYVEPSATDVSMWQGWKNATGNGLVVISWQSK